MTQDYSYLAKEAFKHACAFFDCANYFMTSTSRDDAFKKYYIHPVIVNIAFACEIFLKSIMYLYAMEAKGHSLKDLIKNLPEDDKMFLDGKLTKAYNGETDMLGSRYLENISNAFTDWRYSYEKSEISLNLGYLITLATALKELCETRLTERSQNG